MDKQKGNILLLLIILLAVLGVAGFVYYQYFGAPEVATYQPDSSTRSVKVNSKTSYQNPFEASSSSASGYSNPFDSYENPFTNLK